MAIVGVAGTLTIGVAMGFTAVTNGVVAGIVTTGVVGVVKALMGVAGNVATVGAAI